MTKHNRLDGDYQKAVRKMVSDRVIHCASQLMDHLWEDESLTEKLFEAFIVDDYEEPAMYHWMNTEESAFIDAKEYFDCDDIEEFINDSDENARNFCGYFNLEPVRQEVLEYWIVDSSFAQTLKSKGEMVIVNLFDFCIWGRTTSGQCIYMDEVMCEIFDESGLTV